MWFLDVVSLTSPIQMWAVELVPEETEAENLSKLLEARELALNLGNLKP